VRLLPGEPRNHRLPDVDTLAICDHGGELPWAVEIDGMTWGIFRTEVDAVVYMSQTTGMPRASIDIMRAVERANDGT